MEGVWGGGGEEGGGGGGAGVKGKFFERNKTKHQMNLSTL